MLIITFEINNVTEGRFVNRTHCYKFNDARILVAIFKEYQSYLYSTE